MLTKTSRYLIPGLYLREGEPTIRLRFIDRKLYPNSHYYVVTEGDTLDYIAYRVYGDPRFWWVIADANPSLSFPISPLTPGQRILIPPLEPTLRKLREARK